ncbi:hypothetical protein ABPG72_013865 [Tetrahymena utriculariae]
MIFQHLNYIEVTFSSFYILFQYKGLSKKQVLINNEEYIIDWIAKQICSPYQLCSQLKKELQLALFPQLSFTCYQSNPTKRISRIGMQSTVMNNQSNFLDKTIKKFGGFF